MRHGKKINHLGRTTPHRKAMLSNMATSLILNKRVTTTVAKAKELRKYVEPLITKAKTDSTHSRRSVFSYLQDKESVQVLFNEVADRVAQRPGGYTRIIRTGYRLGDNAEMCLIELVDYNENLLKEAKPAKPKTRRRKSKKAGTTTPSSAAATAPEAKSEDKVEVGQAVEEPSDKAEGQDPETEPSEPAEVEAKSEPESVDEASDQTDAEATEEVVGESVETQEVEETKPVEETEVPSEEKAKEDDASPKADAKPEEEIKDADNKDVDAGESDDKKENDEEGKKE